MGMLGCRGAAPHCGRESEREGEKKGEGEWLDAKLTKPDSREQHQPTRDEGEAGHGAPSSCADRHNAVLHGALSHCAPPDMQPPRGERHKTGRPLLGCNWSESGCDGLPPEIRVVASTLGMINSWPSSFHADTLCQTLGIKVAGDFPASMHGFSEVEVQVRSWSRASVLRPPFNLKIPSAHAR